MNNRSKQLTSKLGSKTPSSHRKTRGFTVIELMAVVAIVSILAVIALTAYGDYADRAKVAEGLAFAGAAKTTVTESYYSNGIVPTNNAAAGLPAPDEYDYTHISKLEIGSIPVPGVITITYRIPSLGADNLLQLVPTTQDGDIIWNCTPPAVNGIRKNKLPPICRI